MFCASLSNLVKHLQLLLFMTSLPHLYGFRSPALLVVEPLEVSSSSPLFRPGLSVLKQLSSEVAGAGDNPGIVEVNAWGELPVHLGRCGVCTPTRALTCACTERLGNGAEPRVTRRVTRDPAAQEPSGPSEGLQPRHAAGLSPGRGEDNCGFVQPCLRTLCKDEDLPL